MDTQIEKTEISSNRKKRQKKPQNFDVLILKRSGTPRSFSINSKKIKFLLFLLFLLIISVPINIYFLHYQYNRIAALSSEIEMLLANSSKHSTSINVPTEISKKLTVAQSAENNLNSPALASSLDRAIPDKQPAGDNIENSAVADNTSNKPSDSPENIEEPSSEVIVQASPPVLPSNNIAEVSNEVSSPPQEEAVIPSQDLITETESQQDQAPRDTQEQSLEYAVIIDNIYNKLTQDKLSISFDIVNKGRGQKNGYVCMIIYSNNEEDKTPYVIHPERVGIDDNGNPLSYKRGIPFSIYSFRHISTDIYISFKMPFFVKFMVYNNSGDITYDKIIDITS